MGLASAFTIFDFLIFAIFLTISIGIGLYHGWRARALRRQAGGTDDFLMGGRQMPVLPVAMSLLTTFSSGITLLGTPAEIYERGLLFWIYYFTGAASFVICAVFFLPIFFSLKPTSIYEYFERRFDSKLIRKIAASIFILNTIFYMSVVIYAPSVALSGVTKFSTWPFILIAGVVCTFYTTIGGLKAVVWTDTIQSGFMYAGMAALVIKGTMDVGGPGEVWRIAEQSGRLASFGYIGPSPAQHNSLWIAILGTLSFWMSLYGLNQMAMQRYCSLPSLRKAYCVIAITIPAFLLLGTMAVAIGLIMLAYFYNCDPLATGEISTPDQLVILFATKVLGAGMWFGNGVLPGFPGLFLACLYSGTLSTISSGMNSLAAVVWEDILKEQLGARTSDGQQLLINKLIVIIFGAVATAMAFLAGPMGGIIKASLSMMGALAGPLVGLFFLGVFVPRGNRQGALIAILLSSTFTLWICLGNFLSTPYANYKLPTNTTCIDVQNATPPESYDPHFGNPEVFYLYRISSYLYPFIAIVIVLIVGPVSSCCFKRRDEPSQMRLTFGYDRSGYNLAARKAEDEVVATDC